MLPELAGEIFDTHVKGGHPPVHISGPPEGKFVYKVEWVIFRRKTGDRRSCRARVYFPPFSRDDFPVASLI